MRIFLLAAISFSIFHVPGSAGQELPGMEWENCSPQGSSKAIVPISDTRFACASIGTDCDIPAVVNLQVSENTGSLVWQKSYSFGTDNSDYVYSLANAGNGFIMSAFENHAAISSYHLIIRTDNSGDTLWSKKFNVGIYSSPVSSKIIATNDGGYCLAAATYTSDLWQVQVKKLNSNGLTTWSKTYGGSGDDYSRDIIQTADGGFMIAATTSSQDMDVTGNHGGNDIWVFKINSSGILQWQHCYGGSGSDEAKSMVKVNGNKYSVLGISTSTDGNVINHHGSDAFYDNWLIKISDTGNLLWNNSYGGSSFEFGSQLVTNTNGNLVMVGSSYSDDGDINDHHGSTDYDDIWTICTDSSGVILWSKSNGGSDYDNGYAIGMVSATQYVVGGNSLSMDGDLTDPCVTNDCYPIAGKWLVKLNSTCAAFPTAGFTFTQTGNTFHFTNTSLNATTYSWDFGDGETSNSANPNHTYNGYSVYTVCLTATYNTCSSNTYCTTVGTCNPVTPTFTYDFTGLTVSFSDNTTGAADRTWEFGDGGTSTVANPEHTYTGHQNYTVVLQTWDSCGNSYSASQVINTCNGLDADYTYTTVGNSYDFTDNSLGEPNTWFWDFGDGATSQAKNPDHSFVPTSNDTFLVCLTISHSQCTNSSEECNKVSGCEEPSAAYGYDVNDNEVSFSNNSKNATQYLWDFGDGTTSTQASPVHDYPSVMAAYDVCMIAAGPCGQDTSCKTIFVGKNPVTALFTYFASGLTVVFTNMSSANATTFSWTFGDGGTSTTKNPFHTYATNGIYNVCLVASDAFGDADTLCQNVYVCDAFSSGFSYSSNGLTTTFTDLSNEASEWTWYFGDGNTSVAQNPTHTFPSNGVYDVCLISSNVCGIYDTTCQTITVCQPLAPDFTLDANYLSVQFTDLTGSATSWLWVFDDGNFSTLQNPVHNYAAPGTYESVCLIATDLCNNSGTTCQSVTVCNPITAAFNANENNLFVSFTDQTGVAAIQWAWTFGDGGTSSQKNPSHTYSGNGTYEVCLVATDVCGNKDTACQSITVCKPLVANYNFTSDYLTVSFSDITPNSSGWVWYFGDDSTSFEQDPVHSYNSPGTYNVCLVASDICGNSSNICQNITVCSPVAAQFSTSTFYLTATFSDQTDDAVNWKWNFGDGATSNNQNPSHTYSGNGTYDVCLIAKNVCGYADTLCESVTVCQQLNAEYSYSDSYLTVSFSNLTANAITWAWDFDDNTTSTAQNPVHAYLGSGTYDVCLVVTDVCNNSSTECKTITVCAPINASFNTSTLYLTASFTDQTGGASQWLWDFGDGGTSTSQNPSHSYSSSGTYNVCLTVTDVCGNTSTSCQAVNVCDPVAADFSYTVSSLTAQFSDATPTAVQWHWDFGDGISSAISDPTHTYLSSGIYDVCLIATDMCGQSDTTCKTVDLQCPPFDAAFDFQTAGGSVTFLDQSTNSISWYWDFGDGTTSTVINPTHIYIASGNYFVCLIASDGCSSDTTCQTVTVVISSTGALAADVFSLDVYPNPLLSFATVDFTLESAMPVRFDLYDLHGKNTLLIADKFFTAGNHTISMDCENLASGIYFLRMMSQNGVSIKKVIVQ